MNMMNTVTFGDKTLIERPSEKNLAMQGYTGENASLDYSLATVKEGTEISPRGLVQIKSDYYQVDNSPRIVGPPDRFPGSKYISSVKSPDYDEAKADGTLLWDSEAPEDDEATASNTTLANA